VATADELNAARFPPPWHVDEATESFCIRDANGQALAYFFYFEDETGRLMATHRLTREEAIPSTSPKCAAQKPPK